MLCKNLSCKAKCFLRSNRTVGPDVKSELIEVSLLTNTGILNLDVNTLDRSVDGINCDHTDRSLIILVLISADISTTIGNGEVHVKFAVGSAIEMSDDKIRIDDLKVIRLELNIGCTNNAFTLEVNVCLLGFVITAEISDNEILDIHDDLGDIFLYSGNGAEFMQNAVNLDLAYC